MKALLFLVGLIFVVAGAATGFVSQMDYGNALIGLNLGLAATLLVGGFIVIGLAAITGALTTLADDLHDGAIHDSTPFAGHDAPFPPATAAVGASAGTVTAGAVTAEAAGLAIGTQFEKAANDVDSAIDKVAKAAEEAKHKADNTVEDASDEVIDAADKTTDAIEEVTQDAAATAKDASQAASAVVDSADEKVADTVATVTDDATDGVTGDVTTDEAAVTTGDDAGETDETPAPAPQDTQETETATDEEDNSDQLYVVEELVIRGKASRVLSDNTVEAETAEGWMRFENVEHLEEYLDAVEKQT